MAKLIINNEALLNDIAPEIYGHFSEHLGRCIYEGLYVGENSDIPNVNGMRIDVVEALKEMKVPVLRWPGGCFADEYHWKDGIGPKETRKKMINTHWGGVVEDNSFGTHEYFELAKQLGCKTYINGNVGSGTVQEMSEWVEYMTFNGVSPMADMRKRNGHEEPYTVDFFGVGNESWGCGGNMRPTFYADEYRRYQTYIRNYDGNKPISKICCGANADDYNWTKKVLDVCFDGNNHGFMNGLSLHYYTLPTGDWGKKGSATDFDENMFYQTIKNTYKMETLIKRHGTIMDEYDPDKKIGLMIDEWGIWTDVEPGTNPGFLYQQNTMRDALIAAINLNMFNKYSDRVKMACIAQMINVLQAVILTEGEKMIKTPTYAVFNMFKYHQGAKLLGSSFVEIPRVGTKDNEINKLSESVSVDKDGVITVTISNASLESEESIDIVMSKDSTAYAVAECYIVKGAMNAHNTFEAPDAVKQEAYDKYEKTSSGLKITLPACSVVSIRLKK